MKRLRKLAFMSLTFGTAIGLSACGDDSDPPTGLDPEFPGDEIVSDLDQTMAAFEASADANSFLVGALMSLAEYGFVFEPSTGSAAAVQSRQVGELRGVSLVQSNVTIPSDVLGKTFVYSATTGDWEIDESRTGAPANGVRVIWYPTDGVGTPLPQAENGYFDLTDEDGDGLSRLGVQIVSTSNGDSTLADYTVGFGRTDTGTEWTERYVAEGFVRGAERQVDFQIDGGGGGNGETGDETGSFDMSFQSGDTTYDFDLTQTLAGDTGVYDERLTVSFTRDGVTTEMDLTFSGTDSASEGSGTLTHDDVVIAHIVPQGDGQFGFTNPDGEPFSQAAEEQLGRVVNALFMSGFYMLLSIPLLVPII